jgi:hypothetical protein
MYRSKCTALRDYAGLRDAGIKNIYKLGRFIKKIPRAFTAG